MKSKTTLPRRVLSIALSVLMLLSTWVFVAPDMLPKASAVSTWNGTVADPGSTDYYTDGSGNYHLESAQALVWFLNRISNGTNFNGLTVYLETDIDLASIDFGNNVFPYNDSKYFQGTFDGQNHTISNFKMTHNNHRVAMFRQAKGATFKNVTYNNVFIDDTNNNGKNGFAVLVGYANDSLTFENVHITDGEIYGNQYVGSLVGEYSTDNKLTLTGCSNGASVYSDSTNSGGLVGRCSGAIDVINCSNTGDVYTGSGDGGGLVGKVDDDTTYFKNCTNTGSVSAASCAGGILGYISNPTLSSTQVSFEDCTNRR